MAANIGRWLDEQGVTEVVYKAHPREPEPHELALPRYRELVLDEPLESHLARQTYDVVCGCSSTALITARQILGSGCRIASFGLECMSNLDDGDRNRLLQLMLKFKVEVHSLVG